MNRRITALFLLAAMLTAFISCGDADVPGESTDSTESPPPETIDPDIPDFEYKDFGNVDFNVVSTESGWTADWFVAEAETGDTLNDAVYKRNLAVEEALNINLTYAQIDVSNMADPIRTAVMSGDCDYHIALTHQMSGVSAMVTENLLTDLSELPHIDFDKPYWQKACNEAMEINGHQYYAASDYMKKDTYGIYFNKTMIDEYKLENPYDLVRSGDWTLDKMAEMANDAANDLNGDTKMDYQDQYGFSSMADFWLSMFIWSSDLRLCEPETLELALMSERTVSLFEKLYALIYESGCAYTWSFRTHFDNPEQRMLITSGRVLFTPNTIGAMSGYRDSEVDFGILPMPKFDKEQDDYANINWNGLLCVPAVVSDPEMVGMAAELLAYYGRKYVTPAYYDTLLGAKLARDEDMREMIEFMFDHMVYDAGMHYFGQAGSMRDMYYSPAVLLFDMKSKDFASFYAAVEVSCKKQIEDFWTDVKKNSAAAE